MLTRSEETVTPKQENNNNNNSGFSAINTPTPEHSVDDHYSYNQRQEDGKCFRLFICNVFYIKINTCTLQEML